MVDCDHVHGGLLRIQFESGLLLQGLEQIEISLCRVWNCGSVPEPKPQR